MPERRTPRWTAIESEHRDWEYVTGALEDQRDQLIARYPSIYRRVLAAKRARERHGTVTVDMLPIPDYDELEQLAFDKSRHRDHKMVARMWANMHAAGWNSKHRRKTS